MNGNPAYDVGVVATDFEDDSVIENLRTVVKAVTPLQVECDVMMMMADDLSLGNLTRNQPPFYAMAGFLEVKGESGAIPPM